MMRERQWTNGLHVRSFGIVLVIAVICSVAVTTQLRWTTSTSALSGLFRTIDWRSKEGALAKVKPTFQCRRLTSNLESFEVELCQSSVDCGQGFIRIHAKDSESCGRYMVDVQGIDARVLQGARLKMGPHDFYALFQGAEKYAVRDIEYRGQCTYRLHFDLRSSGDYTLNLALTHENFEAINETLIEWPRYLNQSIVTDLPISFTACPQKSLSSGKTCGSKDSGAKGWIRSDHNSTSGYDFRLNDCPWSKSVPKVEKNETTVEAGPLRKGLIMGDSQARSLWDTASRRMRGGTERIERVKVESGSSKNGTMQLDYRWDSFLEDFLQANCTHIATYDAIFFQVAQWPASFSTFWTTKAYIQRLQEIIERVETLTRDCPTFKPVWLGINAFPLRDDDIIKQVTDHRTPQRLRLWDTLATNLFRSHGIAVANAFNITLAMLDTSEDLAHYLNTDAEEALVDNMFDLWMS